MKEAIQQEEMLTRFEAIDLEHERREHRSLDWVENKARDVISLVQHEMIDVGDALHLIAAIVGYENDEAAPPSDTNP